MEIVARVSVGGGRSVERLVGHPRLPLVAGLDSARPAVHVWSYAAGQLRALGTVGGGSAEYADTVGRQRLKRTPAVAWHPEQPVLLVSDENALVRWTPTELAELAFPGRYRHLAFAQDGQTVWAAPSVGGGWERTDVLDLASGQVDTGPRWDTGVATHPAGGLVVTLCSDQGATLGLFARVDNGSMRVLRRALILDVDGYETPLFSADGRYLAIRGNAYENTLAVFDFPSLRRVLATTLGEPNPGYPYPPEWLEQLRAWSRHNIAFGAQPGVLWVGTPTGTLVAVDLDAQRAVEHDQLAGSPVTALAATITGQLMVATGAGELVLLSVGTESVTADREGLAAFLAAALEVSDLSDLESDLVLTDGSRSWDQDDLATVTTTTTSDPTWLRLQAQVNKARD